MWPGSHFQKVNPVPFTTFDVAAGSVREIGLDVRYIRNVQQFRGEVNRMEERMNTKRWLLASVAVFVVIMVLEFVIHGMLLSGIYQQTASVWRTQAEMQSMTWIFWVSYLVFALFFALIYVKGYEKGKPGLGQGFRFGLYVGAMLCVMHGFGWYVILPIPLALSLYWSVAVLVEFIAAGVAAGLIYHE